MVEKVIYVSFNIIFYKLHIGELADSPAGFVELLCDGGTTAWSSPPVYWLQTGSLELLSIPICGANATRDHRLEGMLSFGELCSPTANPPEQFVQKL